MLYIKSCTRCGGDVASNSDTYGEYLECLACGRMVDLPEPRVLKRARSRAKASAAA